MAALHHMNHHHPLRFDEDTSPSHYSGFCHGCSKLVQGPSYSCGECRFYLHKKCAEAPLEICHPAHRDHPLLLLLPGSEQRKRRVNCRIYRFEVKGFVYHCSSCEFYLDVNCALLPRDTTGKIIKTLHAAHEHPLFSINLFGYFNCEGCRDTIKEHDASFTCFDCGKFFHKKCLELPTAISHPCHRKHQLTLYSDVSALECLMCRCSHGGFFYRCVPCEVTFHVGCAWPPSIIVDKYHHDHPFTLLLRPNNTFECNACGNRGNHVSYICSTCNIQVHKDCVSLPRCIKLTLHPHPISHCFFLCIDHHDSRTWDCRICYGKVNIEHGSYYCPQPGCDFVIHVKCSIKKQKLYWVLEVGSPDEYDEFMDPTLLSDESMSSIVRVIKKIKVGDDEIAGEIEHVSHEHNLIFSDEFKGNKYCNGCVLPIAHFLFHDDEYEGKCSCCDKDASSVIAYRCKDCTFALHWRCATLPQTAWHKCDKHSLTLAYRDRDDYPLRRYCDICEEERDPRQWFYCCETCDNTMHIECVLGKYSFIRAGSRYAYEGHPHTLTFVKKIYYYAECNDCGEPCQDLALECEEHGCKYIVHWDCIAPQYLSSHIIYDSNQ
ncbi:uncharacterized protein LOC120179016 [Hibiscus syriacus]|uniref:uncharacterized protein LOC120179016 n=1 Tax=Hibiscus syriacus TaxID=106335 RepID=UPI001923CEDF|nr:uncharacterized protein LOC120179016 [Hibiscus syriacus]